MSRTKTKDRLGADKAAKAATSQRRTASTAQTTPKPAPGLDDSRHTAAQRAAHGAEVLKKGVFPALMASALSLDTYFEAGSYQVYLTQILTEAGNPQDPVERMLVEQLCLAHFRVAQMHVGASHASGCEAIKMYITGAARLLGEMRRTALALRAYRTRVPEQPENVKILRMAR